MIPFADCWHGNVNSTLYSDFEKYKKRLISNGISIDCCTLSHSYRCSPSVCKFIECNFNISVFSHRQQDTKVEFIDDPDIAWSEATNDFERFIAAYYAARHQENILNKLNWLETSLQFAQNK